jgi:hypothetical protein
MKPIRATTILLHIVVWSIYVIVPTLLFKPPAVIMKDTPFYMSLTMTGACITVAVFYYNYYWGLPKYFLRKKYITYILALLAFLLLVHLLPWLILSLSFGYKIPAPPVFRGVHLFKLVLVFAASFAIRFYKKYKASEAARVKAELSSLKAQINPHFLFNTLNGIYGQALIKSDQTADSISRLSSIMRYVMTEAGADAVPLVQELKYIENYVRLQKVRLTEKTKVIFDITGKHEGKKIPPLLLICFIENSFKYGVSTEIETEIYIHIDIGEKEIALVVKNQKCKSESAEIVSAGTGLANAKKRLEIIYGGQYVLNTKQDAERYETLLKIKAL